MKNTIYKYTKITAAIVMGIALNQAQLAMAGWTGAMNGTGLGKASVNVLGFQGDKPKSITSTNMLNPSAAMTITTGYVFGTLLPKEASAATVAKVRGFPAYVWDATTIGSNGDSTDNTELESRVTITPADCASLEMASSAVIDTNDKSGTITMNAKGTAGTAVWSRGYELPEGSTLPPDLDPENPSDVSAILTFLKENGSLKWDVLLVGPFDLSTNHCTAVTIPFTVETNASKNLYFVTDGVAKSLPLDISQPDNKTVECDKQPVNYPGVNVYGCTNSGPITVTYNPPAGTSFPVGVWPVTITAKDGDGNEKSTNFTVTVTDTKPPTPDATSLPDVTGQCAATISSPPTATDTCSGTITGTTTDSLTRTTQGTSIVTWKFDDGHGNVSTQTQKISVTDTTPPVIAATGTPTSGVLGMNPGAAAIEAALGTATATDNCGAVTPTAQTSVVTVNGCSRSQTRTWNTTDATGNSATPVSRTVTWTQDTTPPAIPSLPTVTGACGSSVTLPVPTTATDNCGGTVTVSPNVAQTFTTPGTNRVEWTFTDAAGNSSKAYQTGIVASLTFSGFYSPIGGTGGTCQVPLIVKCTSSTLPIKFDMKCGTTPITGGTPPVVRIQAYDANCAAGAEIVVQNAVYQNDWHYNWNVSNRVNGTYKITVVLPDGTSRFVFVKLK